MNRSLSLNPMASWISLSTSQHGIASIASSKSSDPEMTHGDPDKPEQKVWNGVSSGWRL